MKSILFVNSKNLLNSIQMQLCQNLQASSQYSAQSLEPPSNSKHFEKIDVHRSLCIFDITVLERHG